MCLLHWFYIYQHFSIKKKKRQKKDVILWKCHSKSLPFSDSWQCGKKKSIIIYNFCRNSFEKTMGKLFNKSGNDPVWGKQLCLFAGSMFSLFPTMLNFFPGRVIVATSKGVYILVPLPLEKQIQDLLASRRVEEALVLAKGARRNIPKEKFQVCN